MSDPFTAIAPPRPPFSNIPIAVLLMNSHVVALTENPLIATAPPIVVKLYNTSLTLNLKS